MKIVITEIKFDKTIFNFFDAIFQYKSMENRKKMKHNEIKEINIT